MKIPASCFDPELGLYAVFVRIPRRESVLLKLLLETYEGLAAVRSVEPDLGGPTADHVLLVVKSGVEQVERILTSVHHEVPAELLSPGPALIANLHEQLLGELVD